MYSQNNEQEILNQAALLAVDLYTEEVLSKANSLSNVSHKRTESPEFKQTMKSVRDELEKNVQAKRSICAALGSVKNDLFEVTKITGAALLPLSICGVVAIPITPLAFAVAGLIVFNAGISAYCSEFTSGEKRLAL